MVLLVWSDSVSQAVMTRLTVFLLHLLADKVTRNGLKFSGRFFLARVASQRGLIPLYITVVSAVGMNRLC